jgi:hypothetical protein
VREELRLKVFENKVLSEYLGLRGMREQGNGENYITKIFNDFYSSTNIVRLIKSRRMMWAGHVASMGERWGVYRVLVGQPEGKRPLGRSRHRWENTTQLDLQEVGCGGGIILRWIFSECDVMA